MTTIAQQLLGVVRSRYNAIPSFEWEHQLAQTAGVSIDILRYTLSFFTAVALASGIRLLRNPTARNLYSLATGFLLVYYPFGNAVIHAVPHMVLTYLALIVTPKKAGILGWLINFPYLIAIHWVNASGTNWSKGELDFTGAQMVLVLKLIAMSNAFQDAQTLAPEDMNDYQKAKALHQRPPILQYLGYCVGLGNLLSGPTVEFRDYQDFIQLQGPYAALKGPSPPRPLLPGLQALLRAVVGMVVHLALMQHFSLAVFGTPWYRSLSIPARLGVQWLVAFTARNKYYFAWSISEAALVFAGLSYEPGADGKPKWDKYCNTKWFEVETADSFRLLPVCWNIHTGNFLRRYVYDRLTPRNGRPGFGQLAVTQLVSALWHGLYAGYVLFFLSSALAMHGATCIHKWERTLLAPVATSPVWRAVKVVYTAIVLNYLASSFVILKLEPCLDVFASVYYIPHIMMFGVVALHSVFPGRSRKPAAKTE